MTRRSRVPIAITVFIGLTLLVVAAVQAQDGNQAALVVRFSEDRIEQRCIAFSEEEITGLELLERSGLAFETLSSGMGVNVCSVDDVGCGSNNCFCQCQGANCVYWSYWRLQEDGWRYSGVGAHGTEVTNGDVEGWSWGPGSVNQAIPPPQVTFEEICVDNEEVAGVGPVEGSSALTAMPATSTPDAVSAAGATGTPAQTEDSQEPAAQPSSGQFYLLFGAIAAGLFLALLAARRVRRT